MRILMLVAILAAPVTAAAQVRVIISGGFNSPYQQVLPEFEQSTGIKVMTTPGMSQGDNPQTISAQLRRGVPADVAFMPSTTGIYLKTKVFPQVGIGDEIAKKSNTTGAAAVAKGEADLTIQPVSELLHVKRLIAFLASDMTTGAIKSSGMERPAR